ncbi:MAG: hypothetical protein U0166_18945 [Acidobacteriota bacterium]
MKMVSLRSLALVGLLGLAPVALASQNVTKKAAHEVRPAPAVTRHAGGSTPPVRHVKKVNKLVSVKH